MCKAILFLFSFLLLIENLSAQSIDYFLVSEIIIEGNKRTKPRVIFNELDFSVGDTIYTSELPIRKKENEKRLLGTALFTAVTLNISKWNIEDGTANIVLTLQENWYIYPTLIFELADRNFNVWWTDQNRDFNRVNYGLSVDHINVTGRKDKLKLKIQHGYTRKYELKYNYPYISKTWGAFGEIFFANQKEIGYTTINNKTVFEKLNDERILLRRFRTGFGANYRPDVYHFHDFKVEYHHNSIDEFIASDIAKDYFLNGVTDLRYFALKYDFTFDKRIFNLYPEGGFMFFGNITKEGLGIFDDFNNLSVAAGAEQYFRLSEKWIWGGRIKVKTNLIRNEVAFANNTGLGYGNDLIRGYELYVVDGTDWGLAKTSIRYRLYKKNINWGKYMFLQQFKQMNLRLFLRANLDFGYVNEPTYKITNTLNNRFLVGYGPAVDMLLYHTFIMSFEYSFNHLGENGLFLNSSFNF
ncbi:MAG: outer membrane protein assembly factor BamA [Saprospiraceae bacterium]|jgi:outer membrane protein assembly factor BamA